MTKNEYFDQLNVPYHVRVEQTAWEQRHTLLRIWRIKGVTLKQLVEIRVKMGCESKSSSRVSQICARAYKEEQAPTWKFGSPVERWIRGQMLPTNLHHELEHALDPKPKLRPILDKPKVPRKPRPRYLPYEWRSTWRSLPKIVDLDLSIPLPAEWEGQGLITFTPQTKTILFRMLCHTPQGERYCDLIIDRAWDGDTRPLFRQAIREIRKHA